MGQDLLPAGKGEVLAEVLRSDPGLLQHGLQLLVAVAGLCQVVSLHIQVPDQLGQFGFIPGAGYFVQGYVEGLLLVGVQVYHHNVGALRSEVQKYLVALMASDNGPVFVDDDGVAVAKFFDAPGDFFILRFARLQFPPGIVGSWPEVGQLAGFDIHLADLLCLVVWSVQRASNQHFPAGSGVFFPLNYARTSIFGYERF